MSERDYEIKAPVSPWDSLWVPFGVLFLEPLGSLWVSFWLPWFPLECPWTPFGRPLGLPWPSWDIWSLVEIQKKANDYRREGLQFDAKPRLCLEGSYSAS